MKALAPWAAVGVAIGILVLSWFVLRGLYWIARDKHEQRHARDQEFPRITGGKK